MWPCLFAALASASPAPLSPPAAAQFIARSWGTADGLPQNTVTSIVQTRDGYLWLGTFGGLVRFDGHAFTVFDPGNTPGLASTRITVLREDRKGILWIGTEGGLTKYDGGRFTTFATRDGLPHNEVVALLEDRRNRLWIGTSDGVVRFDGRAFERVALAGPHQIARAMAETPDGDVWLTTGNGLTRFHAGERPAIVDRQTPFSLMVDSKGRLLGTTDRLLLWTPSEGPGGGSMVPVPFPDPAQKSGGVLGLVEDAEGTVWIGGGWRGVYTWRDGAGMAITAADGLADRGVRAVATDREGHVWIGSEIGGLTRLKRRRVFNYPRPGNEGQSIGPIVGDGGDGLWIGATCGGLLHLRAGRFETYAGQRDVPACVWALLRDPDGTLWLGSTAGLGKLSGGKYTSFMRRIDSRYNFVTALARDRDGVLWVGSDAGLSRFENGGFTEYGRDAGLDQRVLCIFQDRRGALWIGSVGGLFRFAGGRFTRYGKAEGLSHEHVRTFHEDADGALWIGTYGGGLNRLEDGRFVSFGINEGLPDVAVSRIIEDPHGMLWMSGNKGVFRVARRQLNDLADGRLASVTGVTYGTADGMTIAETNGGQPAGWRTADGRLWFPTIKGLVSIDSERDAARPPPVHVERRVVNGRPADAGALARLGPGDVDVEFHYTAIDLGAAERTRFRYRLDGYDGQWIDSGDRRAAYYTKIPPGTYHFEVMATDSDGAWSTTPARVAVTVVPFWWQRREAIVGALFLLLAFTGVAVRHVSLRRARARVLELERERAVERERSRIARDLHDDLGSRLSLIGLMTEGTQAVHVARQAAETLDQLVWTVDAQHDTVGSFAAYASRFAEEHLDAAGLRHRFHVQPELGRYELAADTRRQVYLAFKEAVNNVAKHARATDVRITIGVDARGLVVDVADNGRGFTDGGGDATGNGLRNMRERLASVGGDVEMASEPGTGTRISFRAPLAAHLHALPPGAGGGP